MLLRPRPPPPSLPPQRPPTLPHQRPRPPPQRRRPKRPRPRKPPLKHRPPRCQLPRPSRPTGRKRRKHRRPPLMPLRMRRRLLPPRRAGVAPATAVRAPPRLALAPQHQQQIPGQELPQHGRTEQGPGPAGQVTWHGIHDDRAWRRTRPLERFGDRNWMQAVPERVFRHRAVAALIPGHRPLATPRQPLTGSRTLLEKQTSTAPEAIGSRTALPAILPFSGGPRAAISPLSASTQNDSAPAWPSSLTKNPGPPPTSTTTCPAISTYWPS